MWDFEKFILTWRSFSFIVTVLDCTPTSAKGAADIHCVGFTVLDHPSYTPNLAVLDFHLSPKLKEHFRGHQCALEDEVKAVVKFIHHRYAQFCKDRFIKTP